MILNMIPKVKITKLFGQCYLKLIVDWISNLRTPMGERSALYHLQSHSNLFPSNIKRSGLESSLSLNKWRQRRRRRRQKRQQQHWWQRNKFRCHMVTTTTLESPCRRRHTKLTFKNLRNWIISILKHFWLELGTKGRWVKLCEERFICSTVKPMNGQMFFSFNFKDPGLCIIVG